MLFTCQRNDSNYSLRFYLLLVLVVTAGAMLIFGERNSSHAQSLEKLNRFVQGTNAADKAMTLFRQGRDLIEEGDWNKAADRFNRFISDYPRHRDVDAALYWLAYSLKKSERYQDADRQLERLFREYPKSNWIDDARALRVEIAGQVRDTRPITDELDKDNSEIKRIALQSLFQADPERAAAFVADILKPDSKADRKLKETAIALLGQHSGPKSTATLIELARTQSDPKLRRTAIFWLGQSGDEKAFDALKELATKSSDDEIAKAALFALAQRSDKRGYDVLLEVARTSPSVRQRREAIFWLAQRGDENVVDELMKIYGAERDLAVRKHILFALTQNSSARAANALNEIARSGSEVELRKQAIFWLGQRGGEQAVETLIQLYDAEKNPEIKEQLIFALGQSESKAALRKLMQIAKSDTSVEARKKAVFWLGQKRDPEAAKFLEEILK
jgi:HEAT repeat protein